MTTFLITLAITLVLLPATGLFISFSKRRQRTTRHGLTGMCHETGREMCGCCASSLFANRSQAGQSCCPGPAPAATRHSR